MQGQGAEAQTVNSELDNLKERISATKRKPSSWTLNYLTAVKRMCNAKNPDDDATNVLKRVRLGEVKERPQFPRNRGNTNT